IDVDWRQEPIVVQSWIEVSQTIEHEVSLWFMRLQSRYFWLHAGAAAWQNQGVLFLGDWGGAKAVFLTLYLAQDLLKTAVPAQILAAMQPADWDEDLAQAARLNVFYQTDMPFVSTNFARMWEEKRPLQKAQIMWRSATLPPDKAS
ncbi:MAG: hypothetical protein GWP17_01875, partial [Aquificales bacterium]|nr:hypothetical protein [Aquificales bacterium]